MTRSLIWLAIALLGLGSWWMGFQQDEARAMYGYLFAFVCIITIPLGCLIYVLIQHATRAGWSVLTRRIAEFGMSIIPLFGILFLPIAFYGHLLFPWSHAEHLDAVLIKKIPYLNMQFFMIRTCIYFVLWSAISIWFYRQSLRQDLDSKVTWKMWKWSPVSILIYALSISFASFDWLMSLQPHWYSTVFGVYFFSGCFLAGLAFISLMLMWLSVPVTKEHFQDLGKFLFGFTVFWAYIAFSQFMLYWYANIPEETEFYLKRLENGWAPISWALLFINFVVPFFAILSRHVKRNRIVFPVVCIWILLAHFLDIYWLIMPTWEGFNWHAFLPYDLSALIGIGALFMASLNYVMEGKPKIPQGDPRLKESFAFENY